MCQNKIFTRFNITLFSSLLPVLPVLPVSSQYEHAASEDPSEAMVVGSGEQWQVSWSTVAQSRPPTLPDPLETRHAPHTGIRWWEYHLQGEQWLLNNILFDSLSHLIGTYQKMLFLCDQCCQNESAVCELIKCYIYESGGKWNCSDLQLKSRDKMFSLCLKEKLWWNASSDQQKACSPTDEGTVWLPQLPVSRLCNFILIGRTVLMMMSLPLSLLLLFFETEQVSLKIIRLPAMWPVSHLKIQFNI